MADLIERYKITANLPSVMMNYCNRFNSKQLESITEMIYELENSIESADIQPVDIKKILRHLDSLMICISNAYNTSHGLLESDMKFIEEQEKCIKKLLA